MIGNAAAENGDQQERVNREHPQSEEDEDAKRRKKLKRRLTKLGKQVLSNNEPIVNALETINCMNTSWIKLANEDPMATLAAILCGNREGNGAKNDNQSGSSREDAVINESHIEKLVLMIGCSKDRALATLLSKNGDIDQAATALLLGDNYHDDEDDE